MAVAWMLDATNTHTHLPKDRFLRTEPAVVQVLLADEHLIITCQTKKGVIAEHHEPRLNVAYVTICAGKGLVLKIVLRMVHRTSVLGHFRAYYINGTCVYIIFMIGMCVSVALILHVMWYVIFYTEYGCFSS